MKHIAEQNRPFADKGEGAKAEKDDRITISFMGTIDGTPFEGGSADDVAVLLGSGQFIPGFEDQLVGIAAGENRKVNVTFPDNYPAAHCRQGRPHFDVTAKSIEAPREVTIDDEFAKSLGLELLAKLQGRREGARCRPSMTAMSRAAPQARVVRCARRASQVRRAAGAGRAGIRERLEDHRSKR